MRLPLLWLCALATVGAAEPAAKTHLDFRREAEAAYQQKKYAVALAATEDALALRPDSPRYRYNLAGLLALTGDPKAALRELQAVADLGVVLPVQRDSDFASLQGQPEFLRIVQAFAANAEPHGEAEVVAELPGRAGIIEGLAFRHRTGDLFLGDVHQRCIWRRGQDGRIVRFTAEDDELLGVFGLTIDEPRNTLWAATAALPEMANFQAAQQGTSALAEFDLTTGELRRVVAVPADGQDHGLGDLTVAPDGTVYATDSKAPVIWRLSPGGELLERAIESREFGSLQGLALFDRTLVVADYRNGFFAIELATGKIAPLPSPEHTTLLGVDGLVAVPGGIVATQNGVEPQRIVHVTLSRELDRVTGVRVIASGIRHLTDVTLITLVNGRPTWIAGSGWDGFDPAKGKPPAAHTVRLFQANLP